MGPGGLVRAWHDCGVGLGEGGGDLLDRTKHLTTNQAERQAGGAERGSEDVCAQKICLFALLMGE